MRKALPHRRHGARHDSCYEVANRPQGRHGRGGQIKPARVPAVTQPQAAEPMRLVTLANLVRQPGHDQAHRHGTLPNQWLTDTALPRSGRSRSCSSGIIAPEASVLAVRHQCLDQILYGDQVGMWQLGPRDG